VKPSHLGPEGAPHMVDVGAKAVSSRRAVASAVVRMRPETLASLLEAGGPKGDAFLVARLAGIAAGKRTAELIPLAHPIPLDVVELELEPDPASGLVTLRAEARATARTGVELEALTAVSVAALTLYDMAKALQRDIVIERIELLSKEGGRSGVWSRESSAGASSPAEVTAPVEATHEAVVITCSTRAAMGERADESGPAAVTALRDAGFRVAPEVVVLPDDEERIASAIASASDAGTRLVVTTGGTGLTAGDVTPAATRRVIDREVPGLAELMRAAGTASTPMAALSRGIVGTRGHALVVNLPGSPRGAVESLTALLPVLRHALEQLAGGDH
jgi:cyclic pyranopterin phosphate synthase